MKKHAWTVSLRLAVVLCTGGIIGVIATLLIYQGYSGIRSNIVLTAEASSKYATDAVNQSVQKILLPSELTLKMLRQNAITSATTIEERIACLPAFADALNANSIGDAVFIGYESGEFYLLRRFQGTLGKLKLDCPAGTHFILQTKTLHTLGRYLVEVWFFDKQLTLLKRTPTDAFDMDPRTRVWYQQAQSIAAPVATRAYVFFDTGDIGFSMAEATGDRQAVVGVDTTTRDLSQLLETMRLTPGTEMVLLDDSVEVLAYPEVRHLSNSHLGPDGSFSLASLDVPIFEKIASEAASTNSLRTYQTGDKAWYGMASQLSPYYGNGLKMLIAIPGDELFQEARANLIRYVAIGAVTFVLALGVALFLGQWLVGPLGTLSGQLAAVGEFNFSAPIGVKTRFREIRRLGFVLQDMATTISGLREISRTLNRERDLELMLATVLQQLLVITHCSRGAVYLYNATGMLELATSQGEGFMERVELAADGATDEAIVLLLKKAMGENVIYSLLKNREKQLIGVLCIAYPQELAHATKRHFEKLTQYVEAIGTSAAVAIETRQLIHAQKALLGGLIKLVADAIDTKSHYTAGHCQRVPELALMLVEEMKTAADEPFNTFRLSAIQEEEFRVAAWLHDCGKITTPEYVVDKATKLETIYNRIHEIRTRFEVLHRDAFIRYQAALLRGEEPDEALRTCQQEQQQLQQDFAFVAQCNIGGEFIRPEDLERLQDIGAQSWVRNFDARLGLSREERQRYDAAEPGNDLPAQETLLADKAWQIVPWGDSIPPVRKGDPRNVWGFDMALPPHRYNSGELHNLGIGRGTLSAEERFKINDHIVQTICMLSNLPWPEALRQVPAIAGNHHETLTGKGYPRKLPASAMGLCERVMAIADIFEALTAPDRPYKDGKTLSQALDILADMVQQGALDRDIFALFLRKGVYLEYARRYMLPELIDEVDVERYIQQAFTPKA